MRIVECDWQINIAFKFSYVAKNACKAFLQSEFYPKWKLNDDLMKQHKCSVVVMYLRKLLNVYARTDQLAGFSDELIKAA